MLHSNVVHAALRQYRLPEYAKQMSLTLDDEKGVGVMTSPGDPSVREAEYKEMSNGGSAGNGKETPSYAKDLVKNYIAGKWVEGSAGKSFESRNPATGELLGVLTVSNPGDVDKAVDAAGKAFKSWRLV